MITGLRKAIYLLGPRRRIKIAVLVLLALLVGIVEALGALLIFVLLSMITAPDEASGLPVINTISDAFPSLDQNDLIVVTSGIIGGFFLVRGGIYIVQSYLQNRVAHNAGVELSGRLLSGYLRLPYLVHLERNSAELIRNAHSAVLDVVLHAFVPLINMGSEILLALGILIALFVAAPLTTLLILLVLGPVVLLLIRALQPRIQHYGETYQEVVKSNLQLLQQALGGIREIRLTRTESYFENAFRSDRVQMAGSLYRRAVIQELPRVVLETIVIAFILVYLVLSVRQGDLDTTVATLGLFAYAILRVLPSVNRALSNANNVKFGLAAIGLLYDDLQEIERMPPRARGADGRVPFREAISLEGLWFRYGDQQRDVIKDVSLTIRRGESVGFVGETGSGKSTLVDLILGLLIPTSGSVLVDGADISSHPERWYANIGLVPQTIFLLDDTIRNNITFGESLEEFDPQRFEQAIEMTQLRSFVESLDDGVETVVGERGVRLSGGQRQRIVIARALYRDPQVLILDEGTSALDSVTEARLIAAIERLKGRLTLIVVAHRLSTVKACDRVVLMDDGAVRDVASFDDLVARNPQLSEGKNSAS